MRWSGWPRAAMGALLAGVTATALVWLWARVEANWRTPGTMAPVARPASEPGPLKPAGARRAPHIDIANLLDRDGDDPVRELRRRRLIVPVENVMPGDLRRSFDERRGDTRTHEAIDILAPRHTPVLAVEPGVIAKFFVSRAGGNTVYQFDPAERYAYYYAHLDRYAAGLDEGDRVRQGQTLGYVGTSGNAPPETPHLHFAIFRLTEEKRWWAGTPIDPFEVLVPRDR